jgi:hypothetical protein
MFDDPGRVRRLLLLATVAVALVAVVSGSVVLARAAETKVSSRPVAATSSPTVGQGNPFEAALQALVDGGVINQHEADVLRHDIDAGSIDPQRLIEGGVLTAAQMEVVETRLDAVKQSLATDPDSTAPSASSATTKASQRNATRAAATAAHAAFDAAVQALVEDGTINQQQADVLRQHIDAGWLDEQALIDNGTLTAAQMQAVQVRLSGVKQSFASDSGSPAAPTSPVSKDPSKTK